MKRRILFICLLLAAVLFLTASFVTVRREQESLSAKLIRLHVIANSDSDVDQRVKLAVRDAVLESMETDHWQSREEAEHELRECLDELKRVSEICLLENGFSYCAEVTLSEERYPTRVYPSFSLPAGEYLSLRVTLGEGKGKNWWCVVYPSICTAAEADFDAVASKAGFSDAEVRLITADSEEVRLKFRILEWMEKIGIF